MNESNSDSNKSSKTEERARTPVEIVKFSIWDNIWLAISYFFLSIFYLIILIQLLHCVPSKISSYLYSSGYPFLVPNPCLTYIALILAPLAWLVHFKIWQKKKVNKLRLEDPSEVKALIVEAETTEPRLAEKEGKPDYSGKELVKLKKEAKRLGKLGDKNWEEYQILPLKVMLVDFLKPDDLKARAKSSLEKLREYRESMADQFGEDHFEEWSNSINNGCRKINGIIRLWTKSSTCSRGIFHEFTQIAIESSKASLSACEPAQAGLRARRLNLKAASAR